MSRILAGGILSAVGLLWGVTAAENGAYKLWQGADIKVNEVVESARYGHMISNMKNYSGNDTFDRWSQNIKDPENTLWITNPLIYAKAVGLVIAKNIIPASLVFSGAIWAFGGSPSRVAGDIASVSGRGLGRLFMGLGGLTKTVWTHALKPTFEYLGTKAGTFAFTDTKARLALAAGVGLSAIMGLRFFNVFSGCERENVMNYIDGASDNEYHLF